MTAAAAGYVAALGLALVFAVAAATKLAHHVDTVDAFGLLGLPSPGVAAWVVPAFELAVAVGLVVVPEAAGAVALFLLVAFSWVLVDVIRRGARVSSACFGASSSHDISPADLVRNLGLGILAVASMWSGGPSRPTVAAAALVVAAGLGWSLVVRVVRGRTAG